LLNSFREADKTVLELLFHCVGLFISCLDSRFRGNDGVALPRLVASISSIVSNYVMLNNSPTMADL
jgi:hypothetical protein